MGAGLAGLRTAEHCRPAGFDGKLVLTGDEQFVVDNRTTFVSEPPCPLDIKTRTIAVRVGSSIGYDHRVIATGLRPRRLRGLADLAGVHVLRSRDDCVGIRSERADASLVLVVGGGFIGCEVAASLHDLGHEVTLVEPQNTVLEFVVGSVVGARMQRTRHRVARGRGCRGNGWWAVLLERSVRREDSNARHTMVTRSRDYGGGGRASSLCTYDRDGRLTAVLCAGMGGKVMKARAAVASGASLDESRMAMAAAR